MRKEDVSRESAQAICGKMEKETAKVEILPQQQQPQDTDKLYVKTFLIDASISGNAWGVSKQSIIDNIHTFIGKPLVLYKDQKGELDHPPDAEAATVGEWAAAQEPFRIGTIIDVVRKEQFQQGPHDDQYFAIIEVQNKDAKEILNGTSQTLYVSPALADLHRNLIANRSGEIVGEESDAWVGMHLALVREPAYGIRKAQITAKCGGDEKSCIAQLKKARLVKANCGFCVRTALLSNSNSNSNTSQVTSGVKSKLLRLSEQEEKAQVRQAQEGYDACVESKMNGGMSRAEAESACSNMQAKKHSDNNNNSNNKDALIQENERLKEQISLLQSKLQENSGVHERLAKVEDELESERIDKFLAKDDKIADEKLRREKIRIYVGQLGLKLPQVEEMWAGLTTATPTIRKARQEPSPTAEGRALLGRSEPDNKDDEKTQALEALQAIDGRYL
jgi:hypothetical protein